MKAKSTNRQTRTEAEPYADQSAGERVKTSRPLGALLGGRDNNQRDAEIDCLYVRMGGERGVSPPAHRIQPGERGKEKPEGKSSSQIILMSSNQKRLLIQACSERKTQTFNLVPALDLYDGVNYRLIKKYLRENKSAGFDLRILIISAEHGLISSETLIGTYDRKMTKTRAQELQMRISEQWKSLAFDLSEFDKILINAGKVYEESLKLIDTGDFKRTRGGIGEKMQQLKIWLKRND